MANINFTTLTIVTLTAVAALIPLFDSSEAEAKTRVSHVEVQQAAAVVSSPLAPDGNPGFKQEPPLEPEVMPAGGGIGGAGSECVGGTYDGNSCDTPELVSKCEFGDGACATFVVTCVHDGGDNSCACECSNVLPVGAAICNNNLASACRHANNGSWDPDGTCTYSGVDKENC